MSKTSGFKKDNLTFSSQRIVSVYTNKVATYEGGESAISSSARPSQAYTSLSGMGLSRPETYSGSTNSARESYRSLNAKLQNNKKSTGF